MPKTVDVASLMLEQMKASRETDARTLEAVESLAHAVEGFAYGLKTEDAPGGPPAFETRESPPRAAPASPESPAGADVFGPLVAALSPLIDAIREAVAGVRAGGAPPESPAAPTPPPAPTPDIYGFAKETASGDDTTYGLQEPIAKPSTMAPDRPEVPTLKEADVGELVAHALAPLIEAIRGAQGGAVGPKPEENPPAPKPAGEAGAAGGVGVAQELGALAGAASAVTGAFTGVVGVATGFVSALNPAIILPLTQAFSDLSATVGVALAPVIEGATEIVRQFGAVLLPVMTELEPVVAKVTQVFVDLMGPLSEAIGKALEALMPLADAVAQIVQALAPFVEIVISLASTFVSLLKPAITALVGIVQVLAVPLKMLSDLLQALTPIFEVISAVASGVASALKAMLDGWLGGMGGLKDTFAGAQDAVREFSKQMILAITAFAKLAGFDNFVKGFVASFDKAKKQDNTGLAAITGTKTSDFAAFSKEIALASAKAGPGGKGMEGKSTGDWLKDIKEQMEAIDGGNKTLAKQLADAFKDAIRDAVRDILRAGDQKAYDMNVEALKKVNNASPLGAATAAFGFGASFGK